MKKQIQDLFKENERVYNAFKFALVAHNGQLRKSGEPFIIHPLTVAAMLFDYGCDEDTVIAGLLHDVVEDTKYPLEIIQSRFGDAVAFLVDGVTRDQNDENLYESKLINFATKDRRVAIIKAMDKIHNLKTIHHLQPSKQKNFINETKEFYLTYISNFVKDIKIDKQLIDLVA